MLRLGWFSTGRGEGSRGLLQLAQEQIQAGALDARIEFVFSNRGRGEAEGSDLFFNMVEAYRLPLVTLSSRQFRREHGGGTMSQHRVAFHHKVISHISGFHPDILVLAGYMLIISGDMCRKYPTLNLHPALPDGPAGTWQEVIWRLIEQDATSSGATVHLATEVLDAGPVLTYCSFPIRGGAFDLLWQGAKGQPIEALMNEGEEQPLFKQIRQEGRLREGPLLVETLKALAEGRIKVSGGRVLDAKGGPIPATCLNDRVDQFLTEHGA